MNKSEQTLWEQYAGMAMQGLISLMYDEDPVVAKMFNDKQNLVNRGFDIADAMMTERKKRIEAMKPVDAWINWFGDRVSPVLGKTVVEVEMRDHTKDTNIAKCFAWNWANKKHDIIAYRVVEVEEA